MNLKSFYEILFLIGLIFLINSCGTFWGNHPLGNKFCLLEGDKTEDRIIAYCYNGYKGIDQTCRGASCVIPTYARHFSNGHYAEYVNNAIADKDWIIAKTAEIKQNKENYWIINKAFNLKDYNCDKMNCDSVIQSHVIGPLTLVEFQNKIKELQIDLHF